MSYKDMIKQQKAQIEKAQARALAELDTRATIADLMDDLPDFPGDVTFIHGSGYRCEGSIRITAATADIPAIMTALVPVPAGKFKGSNTSFHATERTNAKDPEPIHIAPFIVEIGKVASYPFTVTVTWWAKLGDLLVEVNTLVSDGNTWATLKEEIVRDRGRIVKRYWVCCIEKSQDGRVKWAAPHGQVNNFTFYWNDPDLTWEEV